MLKLEGTAVFIVYPGSYVIQTKATQLHKDMDWVKARPRTPFSHMLTPKIFAFEMTVLAES